MMADVRQLTKEESAKLFALVRAAIANRFDPSVCVPRCPDDRFMVRRGAFVTLTLDGKLRGCIGRIEAHGPLWRVVGNMAVAAAFHDPRFPSLSKEDLSRIAIEISILGPLELVDDIDDIVVGTHGLFIRKGPYSGLLLPQVASARNWDVRTFLGETCRKAGLDQNEWEDNADVYMFTADILSEPVP